MSNGYMTFPQRSVRWLTLLNSTVDAATFDLLRNGRCGGPILSSEMRRCIRIKSLKRRVECQLTLLHALHLLTVVDHLVALWRREELQIRFRGIQFRHCERLFPALRRLDL